MKAILLPGVLGILFLIVVSLAFGTLNLRCRASFLVRLWALCVPLLAIAYLLTPPNLWILPDTLLDDPPWFGLIFSLGLWSAGFFGGVLQLYNLAERGLSLRMLIDIERSGSGARPRRRSCAPTAPDGASPGCTGSGSTASSKPG